MIIDTLLELLKLRRIPVIGQGYIVIPHYHYAPNNKGQYKYGRYNNSIIGKLLSTAR